MVRKSIVILKTLFSKTLIPLKNVLQYRDLVEVLKVLAMKTQRTE